MDNNALVKYYDPRTGQYEFATVIDVGDLQKLNTKIKTDLVSAINSLEFDDIGGSIPPDIADQLENIKDAIQSIQDGTFVIEEWGSLDAYFKLGIEDAIEELNIFNRDRIEIAVEDIEQAIRESREHYEQNLYETNEIVENAKTDLENARTTLQETAEMLEGAEINYTEVKQTVDEVNNYIEDNIKAVRFDLVNAVVADYESLVQQTEDEFGVIVDESYLSFLSGRVGKNTAELNVQSGKIEQKVGMEEFQYMPIDAIDQYGRNLLFYTRDLSEKWDRNDVRAYVTTDSYRHTRIIAIENSIAYYHTISDDLEIGKTYNASIYVNVQPKDKLPTDDKYAPTNGSYQASVYIDNVEHDLSILVENVSGINGWKRISANFVAENENPNVHFRIKSLNDQTSIGYLTAPKLESGNKSTPWQPHFDDNYATLISTHSLQRQQAGEIVSLITSHKELEDGFVSATSSFEQLEEGFRLNAEKVSEYEDAVERYGAEVAILNEGISQKVWKDDFKEIVGDISIDNKNRVLNSDFARINTDSSVLTIENWNEISGDFTIEKIDGINYASIRRTGLTGNNTASMASDKFAVRNGERLMFGFDIIVSEMPDMDTVFQMELFDINDIRVGFQAFTLAQLEGDIVIGQPSRLHSYYTANREDVAKGRVRLQLVRNGSVKFSRIIAQQGTIKNTEWTPAPEDSFIIQSKMQTEIKQTADRVQIIAEDERLDVLEGLLYKRDGKFEVSPQEIIARVTSAELGENAVVTGTQLKITDEALRVDMVTKDGLIYYINASDGDLKIAFDKVEVDGMLLAQIISTQYLDASKGFKIMHNGNMVLGVDPSTGEMTMNIPKLTINAKQPVTEDQLTEAIDNIELTPGAPGQPGQNALSAILTNESISLPANSFGNVTSFADASGDMEVYDGATKVTSGVTYSTANANHLTVTINTAGHYSITGMQTGTAVTSGSITIRAVYKGQTINKTLTVSKSMAGSAGAPAQSIKLNASNQIFIQPKTGSITPTSVTITGSVQNTTIANWQYSVDGAAFTTTTPTGVTRSGSTVTVNNTAMANIRTIVVKALNGAVEDYMTIAKVEDGTDGDRGPRGLDGAQGPKGTDGIRGADGEDGKSSYTHIAYADTITGSGFSHNDATKDFVGIYADSNPVSSDIASKYTWSKWHGEDGADGIKGANGADGKPSYTHIAYANNSTGTSGFSTTDSLNKTYLGIYTDDIQADSETPSKYNWTLIKGADGARGPQGVQGLQGKDGSQGIKGETGADGRTTYAHIAYANNATGTLDFSVSDSNREYVGMYTDFNATDSNDPTKYNWSLIKGRDGTQGIPGKEGADGKTSYLHIAYANNATGTSGFSINDSTNKLYIGTYTDFTAEDSTVPSKYKWTLTKGETGEQGPRGIQGLQGPDGNQGIQGPVGSDGKSSYTHIAYATGTQGQSFSHSTFPQATHIGMYTSNNQNSSSNWRDYEWTLIKGADGSQGIPGAKGADGQTPYFHTAWANNTTGSGFSTTVSTNKLYLGTYTSFVAQDSTDYRDYNWTLIKGDKGDKGEQGTQGIQGPKGPDGTSAYTHFAYGTSLTGAGFSKTNFAGATHIGVVANSSQTSPGEVSAYTWSEFKGKDGNNGTPGAPGADGRTPYFHQAWANDEFGNGFVKTQDNTKKYHGSYWDYTLADSTNPADYFWQPYTEWIAEELSGISLNDKTEILSGTEIFTDKADDDAVVHVEVDGKSYQHAGSGKNIMQGYSQLQRVTSTTMMAELPRFKVESGKNYVLSFQPVNNATTWRPAIGIWKNGELVAETGSEITKVSFPFAYFNSINNWYQGGSNSDLTVYKFTPYDDYEIAVGIVSGDTTSNSVSLNPQMEIGSIPTEYEPPTPSPNYPIEIHSLNDFDVVSSVGKRNYAVGSSDVFKTIRVSGYSGELIQGAATYNTHYLKNMGFKTGDIVTVSLYIKGENGGSLRIDSGTKSHKYSNRNIITNGYVSSTFTIDEDDERLSIYVGINEVGTTYSVEVKEFQIVKSSKREVWTPSNEDIAEETVYPFIDKINLLLDEPLRSVGDVKDRVFRDDDGLWKIERNIGEYIFDGSQSFSISLMTPNNRFVLNFFAEQDPEKVYTYKTNMFPYVPNGENNPFSTDFLRNQGSDTYNRFWVYTNKFNTNEEVVQFFRSNPLTVLYDVHEPTIETLPQSLQDKLNNLRTFKESNYIYTVLPDKSNILQESLKPTLHATFKGGGWAARFKTEQDFLKQKEENQSMVYNHVRYIRDWANGSNLNTGNHWIEIQAIDSKGNNVALGKEVSGSASISNGAVITDGATTGPFATVANGKQYVQVDLGKTYYDITNVSVWHHGGRTYKETKTEVSSDGVNWTPVFDSYIEGEYLEIPLGRISHNTVAKSEALLSNISSKLSLDKDIKEVKDVTVGLKDFTDTAFNDGIVERAEAQAIRQQLNTLNKEQKDLTNQYDTLYANASLVEPVKGQLRASMLAYHTAYNSLITVIMSAIAGGKTSPSEKTLVDNGFVSYTNSLQAFTQKLSEAQTAIGTKVSVDAVGAVELGGRNLVSNSKDLIGKPYRTNDKYLGFTITKTSPVSPLTYADGVSLDTDDIPVGSIHTVSFYAKANKLTPINCHWYSPGTTTSSISSTGQTSTASDGSAVVSITTEWKKYWVTWTQSDTTSVKKLIVGRNYTINQAIVEIAGVMLEAGNKASAWVPSEKDIESSYTAVAQAKAEEERVKAEIYADGKVTAEEQLRINDVNAKLAAAKKYAEDVVGGLEINDVNLLKGTRVPVVINGTNISNQTTRLYDFADGNMSQIFKDGDKVSVSFDWEKSNSTPTSIRVQSNLSPHSWTLTNTVLTTSGTQGRYTGSGILSATQAASLSPAVSLRADNLSGALTIKNMKIQRGDKVTGWSPSPSDIQEDIVKAQTDAISAGDSAATANNLLADIASDSVLTPGEKKNTKKEWDIIVGEKPKIDASADAYSITTQKTAYANAYNALNTYLTGSGGLLVNLNTKSTIVGTTFRTNFKNYYNARQDLLNAISNGAKALVDGIEIGGRNLIKNSQHVVTTPNNTDLGTASLMTDETIPYYRITATTNGISTYGFDGTATVSRWAEHMIVGNTYTVSVDVRIPVLGPVGFYSRTGEEQLVNVANTWTRISHTYTYTENKRVVGISYSASNRIDYRNWQIEKGNKATDWSPATEDTQAQIDKSVKSTQVEYYLSTSNTSPIGGVWETTARPWDNDKFMWSRTKVILNDGTPDYVPSATGTNISGAKGETGGQGSQGIRGPSGANGQSQYVHMRYSANANGSSMAASPISTTKYIGIAVTNSATAPAYTGFTWSKYVGEDGGRGVQGPKGDDGTTTYTWVKYADTDTGSGINDSPSGKKYIGLAFNKTTSSESNTASEYQWSLMPQNIDFGGRNLLLKSNVPVKTSNYIVGEYYMTEDFITGATYTVTLKGSKLSSQNFGIWQNIGSSGRGSLVNVKDDIWSHTFTSVATTSGNERVIRIYQPSSTTAGIATIDWIKLEKGDISSDWTPAPEDVQSNIDEKADGTATNEYLQNLAASVQTAQQEAEAKAGQDAVDSFMAAYNAFVESEGAAKIESERRLSDAITTLAAVESNLGDMAARWNFLDTSIQMSEQGLMIGNQSKGTYILQTDDKISFFSNGTETAYISGNMLHIEQAVFVRSIQIGDFMITEEGAGAISFRSVL